MNHYISLITSLIEHDIPFKKNQPLKEYTSLKIGGPADILARPTSVAQIQQLIALARKHDIPYAILGNGSNTLVLDEGVRGLVIVLTDNFSRITHQDNIITAQAGASLINVCKYALQHELAGMEFAYGIPASVGGAMYMNAGAYGGEMKDVVISCTYLDENNQLATLPIAELDMRYRHSRFTDTSCVVLSADFQLKPGIPSGIKVLMDENMERRKAKQPLEWPSAGSTFKRPANHYASALIDQCGLKGSQIGGAMVSEKHAGFLINANEATSQDMLDLVKHVQDVVFDKTGYHLECEMKILNGRKPK